VDPVKQLRAATDARARNTIRDWQLAHRIRLTKESATDLQNRISSALADSMALGFKFAVKTNPPEQEAAK
jgi:hypothetical protein